MRRGQVCIGIDAGHGGTDRGAVYERVEEADLVYTYATELMLALARLGWARPVTVRTGDYTLALAARGALSEHYRCRAVIALHANASDPPTLRGALAFALAGDTVGQAMGDAIMRAMPPPLLREGEGAVPCPYVPRDDWRARPRAVLLPHAARPVVLVELGYLSHKTDREALLDPSMRRRIIVALLAGVAVLL